jgi:hypothetical protein
LAEEQKVLAIFILVSCSEGANPIGAVTVNYVFLELKYLLRYTFRRARWKYLKTHSKMWVPLSATTEGVFSTCHQ